MPRPARGYLASTAQVHHLAAHHALTPVGLDVASVQAAARHPAAHPARAAPEPPA